MKRPTRLAATGLVTVVLVLLGTLGGQRPAVRAADAQSTPPAQAPASPRPSTAFAATIAALSEPGGYFDTDNLISNERSYLHVIPALAATGLRGGAYLGVGPDQNFSYIGHVRPEVAFLVDIRRDNLLLHLLFKALFEDAHTRVDYLARLFGRVAPSPLTGWETRSADAIARYLEQASRLDPGAVASLRRTTDARIGAFGVPLSPTDRETIDRFHRQFIRDGLALQFNSTGRAPQFGYPTYRDLMLEQDLTGQPRGFLNSEEDFQFIKGLHARHQILPIVGDLSGPTAIAGIGAWLTRRQLRVSAFYTSNVEFYLFRQGGFGRFVENLRRLPTHERAVIIRSVFGGQGAPLPGYVSAQQLHRMEALIGDWTAGRVRSYGALVGG